MRKKGRQAKRWAAFLLTMLLVFSSLSGTTFAENVSTDAAEAVTAQEDASASDASVATEEEAAVQDDADAAAEADEDTASESDSADETSANDASDADALTTAAEEETAADEEETAAAEEEEAAETAEDSDEDASDDEAAEASEESTSTLSWYQEVNVTSDTYSWNTSASYEEMSRYYWVVSSTSNGTTTYTYYQVYYSYSTSTGGGSSATVTFYYVSSTTGSQNTYTQIGSITISSSGSGSGAPDGSGQSVSLYQLVSDSTLDDTYYGFTVDYEDTESLWSESATSTTSPTAISGYYYYDEEANVLYNAVYYSVTTTTDSDGNTVIASVTLYYYDDVTESYIKIGTIYPENSSSSSDEITLYTAFEVDVENYVNTAVVYWDLDDYKNSLEPESNYISSVSFTTAANTSVTINNAESTETSWTETGTALSSIYVDSSGTAIADANEGIATLVITPVSGYYVTEVIIACAPYTPDGRIIPYSCSTYITGNAFEQNFTLGASTSSDGTSYTLSVGVDNKYFAHSGSSSDQVYFILIEVEEVPTPAYVEYDFGEIVEDISAYNSENGYSSSTDKGYVDVSIFTNSASGWTGRNTENVYTDNNSTSYDGTVTQTGGVMTGCTQYEYVYDDSEVRDTEGSSVWEHYANSITEDAVSAAASAGYVFAGWAVTWYGDAEVASSNGEFTKTESNYNYYTITFSNSLYTGLVTEGSSVTIAGHVRLVAQWVKADDFTQVIDYGLPVSLDIIEELEDALTLQALKAAISSRTSGTTDIYDSFTDSDYNTLAVTAAITGFAAVKSEDEESSTYSRTLTGTYGSFSINSGGDAVYTLSDDMTDVESAEYEISLTYNSTVIATPTGTLSIVPATSMYYEENFGAETTTSTDEDGEVTSSTTYGLVTYNDGSSSGWTVSTDSSITAATYQETGLVGDDNDNTYGTDSYYLSNLKDSDGSTMNVDTTNGAASFSYEFTGTGTAIYSRISTTSAYLRVSVLDDDGNYETFGDYESEYYYIDTRVVKSVGDTDTTLYNIPVFELTDLDYDTYTVTVTVAKAGTKVSATYDENGDPIASSSSGKDFYLDGIRIYEPIKTSESVNDDYNTVQNVYEADGEANSTVLNVYDYLYCVSDALENETNGFVTLTDKTTGEISDYDSYFAVGPDNEVYLYSSSSDDDKESTSTSYTLSFYLLNWDSDNYDIYIGMKAPDGTQSTVSLGSSCSTAEVLSNSADCYYNVETSLENTNISSWGLTDSNGSTISNAYKLTISGVTGLAAITWIKVTSANGKYEIAFEVNTTADDKSGEDGKTEEETAVTLDAGTLYMVSEATYASLASESEEDDEVTNEDMLDDDDMGVDGEDTDNDAQDEDFDTEDDGDTDTDGEDDSDGSEESGESVFVPETFDASISYLKLLKYASITVKTSDDVSYITVNGEQVSGKTSKSSSVKTFSYSSFRISSGTTFEIIAYDSDGTASEPVTLTAK